MPKNNYGFDTVLDRRGVASIKWDLYADSDIAPMWVADMDFMTPPEIREALDNYLRMGVYGYHSIDEDLKEILRERLRKNYRWDVPLGHIDFAQGIVPEMNLYCRELAKDKGKIVTFTPVYYPFLSMAENAGIEALNIPLLHEDTTGWTIDLDRFEQTVPAHSILLLSQPHNPTGRVYTPTELKPLLGICLDKNVTVLSDEIHCELILSKAVGHCPTASIDKELAECVVTFMAPTKTFNFAGIPFCFTICGNEEIRRRMKKFKAGIVGHRLPGPAYVAARAAYTQCDRWHKELIHILRRNRDLVISKLDGYRGLKVTRPIEATYLAWIDYRDTGIDRFKAFLESEAKVGLSDGITFGLDGFVRLNYACSLQTLENGLNGIREALANCGS